MQKQIEAFQNTVNELKDLVHVQRQRNDRIELELLKSRNEMEQMKENYLNEIEKLNNCVSNLELIEAKYNRILTAMIEDSQEQMNLSDADLSMEKKEIRRRRTGNLQNSEWDKIELIFKTVFTRS